jgi:hypothetical protein
VTSANIGIYTITLTYTPTYDTTQPSTQSFMLEVYPITEMGALPITCDFYNQTFNGKFYEGYTNFRGGDVSNDEKTISTCGYATGANVGNPTASSVVGFLHSMNQAYQTNFFYRYEQPNGLYSLVEECKFGPITNNLYSLTR